MISGFLMSYMIINFYESFSYTYNPTDSYFRIIVYKQIYHY